MTSKRELARMGREALGRFCVGDPSNQRVKDGLVLATVAHHFGFRLEANDLYELAGALRTK